MAGREAEQSADSGDGEEIVTSPFRAGSLMAQIGRRLLRFDSDKSFYHFS
jgi:hypothetical protein